MARIDVTSYKVAANETSDPTKFDNLLDALAAAINGVDAAGNFLIASLAGYPSSALKFLRGDGSWVTAAQGMYRKTTAKTVNNTVTETDLLNGEITLGAGVPGTTGMVRLTLLLDGLNNSGGAVTWTFKVKFGGSTIFGAGPLSVAAQGGSRFGIRLEVELLNLGAANSNVVRTKLLIPSAALNAIIVGSAGLSFQGEGTGDKWHVVEESAPCTIDTATSKLVEVTVTHGTAAATVETKLYGAVVEIL